MVFVKGGNIISHNENNIRISISESDLEKIKCIKFLTGLKTKHVIRKIIKKVYFLNFEEGLVDYIYFSGYRFFEERKEKNIKLDSQVLYFLGIMAKRQKRPMKYLLEDFLAIELDAYLTDLQNNY